jgi:cytochrome oxidase Cu insertion factor (SCO1/SenC/PrrC family)
MTRKWLVIVLTALVTMPVVAVAVLSLTRSFAVRELPVLGQVPSFALVERSGAKVTNETLRGKVWAIGFIFTHCAGQCPMIGEAMQKVEKSLRLKPAFRLVSLTVDPERDTPQVLSRYADVWHADPYKWLFLTGKRAGIASLVQNGFHLATGETDGTAGSDDISHSEKLVLVDGAGRIRGYYNALDEEEVSSLLVDAKSLLRADF